MVLARMTLQVFGTVAMMLLQSVGRPRGPRLKGTAALLEVSCPDGVY